MSKPNSRRQIIILYFLSSSFLRESYSRVFEHKKCALNRCTVKPNCIVVHISLRCEEFFMSLSYINPFASVAVGISVIEHRTNCAAHYRTNFHFDQFISDAQTV